MLEPSHGKGEADGVVLAVGLCMLSKSYKFIWLNAESLFSEHVDKQREVNGWEAVGREERAGGGRAAGRTKSKHYERLQERQRFV